MSEPPSAWSRDCETMTRAGPYQAFGQLAGVKFLERIPGTRKRFYHFTAIDDCTGLRVLKIYDACNQTTAMRFVDGVLWRLPFRVQVVQTDYGAEFQSTFIGICKTTLFVLVRRIKKDDDLIRKDEVAGLD
jgi:hypothetical protein